MTNKRKPVTAETMYRELLESLKRPAKERALSGKDVEVALTKEFQKLERRFGKLQEMERRGILAILAQAPCLTVKEAHLLYRAKDIHA